MLTNFIKNYSLICHTYISQYIQFAVRRRRLMEIEIKMFLFWDLFYMVHDSNNCESLINERYLDEIIRAENFIFQ